MTTTVLDGTSEAGRDREWISHFVRVPAFVDYHLTHLGADLVGSELRAVVETVAEPSAVDGVLDGVRAVVAGLIDNQAYRTLIRDFHRFRSELGLPPSDTSDDALRRYSRHLAEHGSGPIERSYPVLAERIGIITRNCVSAVQEVFERFRADHEGLVARGLAPRAGIDRVLFPGSDLHRGGRQVVVLEFPDGNRIVYKPRSLATDRMLREMLDCASRFSDVDLSMCVPLSFDRGDYGWQQYVPPSSMDTTDQVPRYFYRFGFLTGLLGSVGATDLHHENLIARGEWPCVVDSETLLPTSGGDPIESLPEVLAAHSHLSLAQTMLVPISNPLSRIDLLMTGFGVDGDQESARLDYPVVESPDTDGMTVSWRPMRFTHTDNLPRLHAQTVSGLDHRDDLVAGLRAGMAAVRGAGLDTVLAERAADTTIRVILRATFVYGTFLDAAAHPNYLADEAEADRLLGLLRGFPGSAYTDEQAGALLTAERDGLRAGDIPYFTVGSAGTEVRNEAGGVPGALRRAPADLARTALGLAAARPDVYHRFQMEECLAEAADRHDGDMSASSVFRDAVRCGPGELWPAVAEILGDLAVGFGDGPDRELGWVCGIGPDRGAPTITPGSYVAFCDNGGIATFLRRAGRRDDRFRAVGDAAGRGLRTLGESYRELLDSCAESVLCGSASSWLIDGAAVDAEWFGRLSAVVDDRERRGEVVPDLVGGPPGILLVVADRVERGDAGAAEAASVGPLVDRLREALSTPSERAWSDLAHGRLGLYWALARAGRVLDDRPLADEAADWLAARLAGGSPAHPRTWCGGSAGRLLAWSEIAVSAGRRDWLSGNDFRSLLDAALELGDDGPVDLSVCHGRSGVVQSVLAVSDLLDRPDLVGRAEEYQRAALDLARRAGWSTGASGRTSLLGYMLGWSGIGDTDLHLDRAVRGDGVGELPVALRSPRAVPALVDELPA